MILRLALSGAAIYLYYNAIVTIVEQGPTAIKNSYGGQLQFLTILGVCAALVHQVTYFLALVTGLRTLAAVQRLALQVSAPLEILIALLYWPLKTVNPDLVLDRRFGFRIAPALDRSLHLWPAIIEALFAVFLPQGLWYSGVLGPLFLYSLIGGGYWVWVHQVFANNGAFPYPLLELLDERSRILLFCGCVVVIFAVFKILQAVQHAHH